jgi:hypothetical protein
MVDGLRRWEIIFFRHLNPNPYIVLLKMEVNNKFNNCMDPDCPIANTRENNSRIKPFDGANLARK